MKKKYSYVIREHFLRIHPAAIISSKQHNIFVNRAILFFWLALACVFSAYIMLIILNYGVSKYNNRFLINEYVTHMAWRPFAYRFLIPELTRFISNNMQTELHQWLVNYLISSKQFMQWLKISNQKPAFVVEVAIVFSFMWLSLIGYMIMLYKLMHAIWPQYKGAAIVAPFTGAAAIPFSMYPLVHIYDLPLLFLWTGSIYYAYKQKWLAFMSMFTLACMNKETALLLIIYVFAAKRRFEWKDCWTLYVPIVLIYTAIRTFSIYYYALQPGSITESYTSSMFRHFVAPWNINDYFRVMTMIFLIAYDWDKKPRFLKYGLILVPIFFVIWFKFGAPAEFRILLEIYPPLILLGTYTLIVSTGLAKSMMFGNTPNR